MKTLIINGSPRKSGDTADLLAELKRGLQGEVLEISAYYDGISPCVDCRTCRTVRGCAIQDGMQMIYADDFENVVIASPIYISNLTGPLVSLAGRFQAYYSAARFLKDPFRPKRKKAALILVGGGDGTPDGAFGLAGWMFRKMNACGFEDHTVLSLHTDEISAREDAAALQMVREIAGYFNENA